MEYTVKQFADRFMTLAGDGTEETPIEFICEGLNRCFSELPSITGLEKLFSKHYQYQLAGRNEWKWSLNSDFRRLSNVPVITFWDTSNGGDPKKMPICNVKSDKFYRDNGIIKLKQAGRPQQYTIDRIGDEVNLVFDRPINMPVYVDYIACGYPKPVSKETDTFECSVIAENLIMNYLRYVWYNEHDDMAFSGAVYDVLDNKLIPEAIQQLNVTYGSDAPIILGEVA